MTFKTLGPQASSQWYQVQKLGSSFVLTEARSPSEDSSGPHWVYQHSNPEHESREQLSTLLAIGLSQETAGEKQRGVSFQQWPHPLHQPPPPLGSLPAGSRLEPTLLPWASLKSGGSEKVRRATGTHSSESRGPERRPTLFSAREGCPSWGGSIAPKGLTRP